MITVAAAAFGYLAVMALRESLSGVLGPKLFATVSPCVPGVGDRGARQLVAAGAAGVDRVAERGFSGWRAQSPPMAFVGALRSGGRSFIVDLPRRRDERARWPRRDRAGTALYEQRRPLLPADGAAGANCCSAGCSSILVVAYDGQRLAGAALAARCSLTGERRRSRVSERIANAVIVRDPAARAGFLFRARDVVSQQDAPPDAGVRRGGRPVRCRSSSCRDTELQARALPRRAVDSAIAVRQPARRLPSSRPRAGGAARELGRPAGVAWPARRRSPLACSARGDADAWRAGRAGRLLPMGVRRRHPDGARACRARAWPARSSCSKR